ncbi:unnamed protein product [Orchesella dallaii]|uniref:C2H2-type domain-containing protein n=1 Tax=Orchesella dallaii TaxID=48710 RepID=A0ABP1PYL6_9HEXA
MTSFPNPNHPLPPGFGSTVSTHLKIEMEMQSTSNCPQCGQLYATSLKREKVLEKCGHVKCWECTYLRGSCILCSRPPPPVVKPPELVVLDDPLDPNDVPTPTPAGSSNGQAQQAVGSGVAPAARGGKGKGAHSKKAVRKLFVQNNPAGSAAKGKAASGMQVAKPKVESRLSTKWKVARRGVPKGLRRGLRPRAPVNATPDVPETDEDSDDDTVPDRSLRSTPSTSTSTANAVSGSGQRQQQGSSAVASTSRKGKKSVSTPVASTSGTAVGGVDSKRTICPICNQPVSSGNIKRHIDLHYEFRPFGCPHCKRSFSRKYSLKNHLLNIHGKTK